MDSLKDLKQSEASSGDIINEYAALYNENPDTIGWLKISGTDIDYVVMYAPDTIDKYLRFDFYGNYSNHGTLYIDEDCDPFKSDNIVIYGHNMTDGSMFAPLLNYSEKDFYEEHKIIQFDTLYEKGSYELVAAIKTEIPAEDDDSFRYYEYTGSGDSEMFEQYRKFINDNALYDTDTELQDGDRLITLSTCLNHSGGNGRFIVIARKI